MSFKDIKGQSKATDFLKKGMQNKRVASAYLFTGPESVGKKFAAIEFAKALNCKEASFDACNTCPSCIKIQKGQHPDIHIISNTEEESKSDYIKIEDIRFLQKNAFLRPYEADFKVFIIDNAHNFTPEAANALLKVLEEPPARSVIILISSKPQLLFKTIISRVRIIRFACLSREVISSMLKEDFGIDNSFAHFLGFFSEGRLGLALNLRTSDILREKNRFLDNFCLKESSFNDESISFERHEIKDKMNLLAFWFRDIYLLKSGIPSKEIVNFDRKDELLRLVNKFTYLELERIMRDISEALLLVNQNINTKLILSNLKLSIENIR